jgi:hypothetical protein
VSGLGVTTWLRMLRGQALSVGLAVGALALDFFFLPIVELGWSIPFVRTGGGRSWFQVGRRSPWTGEASKSRTLPTRSLPDELQNLTTSSRRWRKELREEVGPREWLPVLRLIALADHFGRRICAVHDDI